ncbi:MAG: hypothetical protein HZC18_08335 [Candidatus Omnitrophica bacterium]|nr:hypothetical protein [Candidatus Omnitrophota bacterium]
MSGDLHVEFVSTEKGECRIYIAGYERNPVDVSKAEGFLIINPESVEPEKLIFSGDGILEGYLVAQGKPRKQGDALSASAEIEIPGLPEIIQSFYMGNNHSSSGQKAGHQGEERQSRSFFLNGKYAHTHGSHIRDRVYSYYP